MPDIEAPITPDQFERVLSSVSKYAVLVGRQALAVWMVHYKLDQQLAVRISAITRDVDFLGSRDDVTAIAKTVQGVAEFPPRRGLTALVGIVRIPVGDGKSANVDVIHRVVGLKAEDVRRRAFEATNGAQSYMVMHPLDVLASRVENLATLANKQNVQSVRQANYAVQVAREYVSELAIGDDERSALKAIERVVTIAKSSAGRNIARQHDVEGARMQSGPLVASHA